MNLSASEIRRLVLYSQGLLHKNQFGKGSKAVQAAVEKLAYVQIDTISVVERAHHHVLHSRIENYKPEMLDQLQRDEDKIFEYWAHAAAYLPINNYRYYLPIMAGYHNKKKVDPKWRKEVLSKLKAEGPLQSKDFEHLPGKKSNGWWDWKPAKLAMEQMFLSGELLIKERRGFQKVFDLADNVIPSAIDQSWPSESDQGRFYIRSMLEAQGIASAREIAYNRSAVKRLSGINILNFIKQELLSLIEEGEVIEIAIGDDEYYTLASNLDFAQKPGTKRIRFLSPFDNLVINRQRLSKLFGFDYLIECYVPEPKRIFGYFTLPILYGDKLIGRTDCKANRKSSTLQIKNIWLEEQTKLTPQLVNALNSGFKAFASALNCEEIVLDKTENKSLKKALSL